jgi:hypothetical protein
MAAVLLVSVVQEEVVKNTNKSIFCRSNFGRKDTPLPGPKEVFFRASIDGGANFAATKNLSNNPADSFEPKISVSGNSVYIIWTEDQHVVVDMLAMVSNDPETSTKSNL